MNVFSHSCNRTNIFIRWNMECSIKLCSASLNGTFSSFTLWKYSFHCTHKHSLFLYNNTWLGDCWWHFFCASFSVLGLFSVFSSCDVYLSIPCVELVGVDFEEARIPKLSVVFHLGFRFAVLCCSDQVIKLICPPLFDVLALC